MKSLFNNMTRLAACGVVTLSLVACYETSDSNRDAGGAPHDKVAQPSTTDLSEAESFDKVKQGVMVSLDNHALECAAIRRAIAARGIKDAQLDGYLKQIDAKIVEFRAKIAKMPAEKGITGMQQAQGWVAEIGDLVTKATARSEELLNAGRARGGPSV